MTTLPLIRRAVPIPYERYNSTTPSRKVSSLPHDRFYSACVAEWQHSMRACPVTFATNQQHRFACSPHRTTVHFRAAPTNQRAIVGRLWKMPVMRQNTPPWKVCSLLSPTDSIVDTFSLSLHRRNKNEIRQRFIERLLNTVFHGHHWFSEKVDRQRH